jgi:hypothetical protein
MEINFHMRSSGTCSDSEFRVLAVEDSIVFLTFFLNEIGLIQKAKELPVRARYIGIRTGIFRGIPWGASGSFLFRSHLSGGFLELDTIEIISILYIFFQNLYSGICWWGELISSLTERDDRPGGSWKINIPGHWSGKNYRCGIR